MGSSARPPRPSCRRDATVRSGRPVLQSALESLINRVFSVVRLHSAALRGPENEQSWNVPYFQ